MKKLLTNTWVPFTADQVEVWRELYAELAKSCSGLGVSDVERREILAAMGLEKGHWYTCPNGHVYAIGECGGATQEGTCPECGARIGGTSHRLLETNRIATKMDGATRSSYPWGVPQQRVQRCRCFAYGSEQSHIVPLLCICYIFPEYKSFSVILLHYYIFSS